MGTTGNLVSLMGATVLSLMQLISPATRPDTLPVQSVTQPAGEIGSLTNLDYIVITQTPTPSPTPRPTSTPTPRPTSVPVSNSDLDAVMQKYAGERSISFDLLKKIAVCESRLNPNATNGPYGGLYQFSEGSWKSARTAMNENPDPSLRFNSEEAIKTAAFKISLGHSGIWPICSR